MKDPRVETTQEEFQEQFDLAIRIRDRLTETHSAIRTIRDVRNQMAQLEQRAGKSEAEKEISEAVETVRAKLTTIEEALTQTKLGIFDDMLAFGPMLDNELAFLMGVVLSVDARPTAGAYERYEDLKPVLAEQLTRLEQVQEIDLAALNALVEEKGLAAVVLKQ